MAYKVEPTYDRERAPVMVKLPHTEGVRSTLLPTWSAPSVALSSAPPFADGTTDMAWSSNGQFLALTGNVTGAPSAKVALWDDLSPLADLTASGTSTTAVAFSPDGRFLAVGYEAAPFLRIYENTGSGFTLLSLPATAPTAYPRGLAFSRDGQFLTVGSTSSVLVYQRANTTFSVITELAVAIPTNTTWSPCGRFLAVASQNAPYLKLYSRAAKTFTEISFPVISERGDSIAFSPDGRFLARAGVVPEVYERTGTTFTRLALPVWDHGSTIRVAWSPCGRFLAAATNGLIAVLSRAGTTFTEMGSSAGYAVTSIRALAFSPDGRHLAASHSGGLTVLKTTGTVPPGAPCPIIPHDGLY